MTEAQTDGPWMGIDSAPKGREVIVNCTRWGVTTALLGDSGWQMAAYNGGAFSGNPTHWMPLPPPPGTPSVVQELVDERGHTADAIRDTCRHVLGRIITFDQSERMAGEVMAHIAALKDAAPLTRVKGGE